MICFPDLQALIAALSLLWSDRKTTVGNLDIWDGLHIGLVEEDPEVCGAGQLGPPPTYPTPFLGFCPGNWGCTVLGGWTQ